MVAQVDSRFTKRTKLKTFTRYLSYLLYEGRPLTTKGRWINPLVFALYRLQELLPFAKKVEKPVFILGTGRSGTTILGVTLGIHKDVGFLNEPKALWSHLYNDEDLIGSYQNKVGRYFLTEQDANNTLKVNAHKIFGSYLRFTLSNRVVDKYPELIFRVPFVKEIFPDAKFLFLFRNGWDTCHSIKHWSERLGVADNGNTHDWWGVNNRKWIALCDQVLLQDPELKDNYGTIKNYTDHVAMAAVEWILTMKQGLSLSQNSDVYAVKYEQFVTDSSFRDEILKFCYLSPDTNFNDYCSEVLKSPKKKSPIVLPIEISEEFNRIMKLLGYE
ncbi:MULTISPECIES: sulfotransferase family protein [Pseudoalteromonas]|uniref:sulfotransferase family protein n=1 Tax=Pseudoalteromonas TaxID=53246 RepID=UPI0009DE4D6F|nr:MULTISPECIES: sulfotransferase [Pseudoalteromonas]ATG59255.1 sulfotransferase [Pseudoalteromonas marina]